MTASFHVSVTGDMERAQQTCELWKVACPQSEMPLTFLSGIKKEVAVLYFALHGLRQALLGNAEEARRRATLATAQSAQRDVHYGAALALAYAGDDK